MFNVTYIKHKKRPIKIGHIIGDKTSCMAHTSSKRQTISTSRQPSAVDSQLINVINLFFILSSACASSMVGSNRYTSFFIKMQLLFCNGQEAAGGIQFISARPLFLSDPALMDSLGGLPAFYLCPLTIMIIQHDLYFVNDTLNKFYCRALIVK